MGSKDSTTINNLRFQKYDSGVVHVHDDKQGVKFEMKAQDFKVEVEDIMKELSKCDGAVRITGNTNVSLFLLKQDNKLTCVVAQEKDTEKELATFIKVL